MGLRLKSTIKQEAFGSYHRLHILRKWILVNLEGNSDALVDEYYRNIMGRSSFHLNTYNYNAFLNHSDCDGCYINRDYYGINDVEETSFCGDIQQLAREMINLYEHISEMPKEVLEIYEDFCSFIFPYSMDTIKDSWDKYRDLDEIEFVMYLEFC